MNTIVNPMSGSRSDALHQRNHGFIDQADRVKISGNGLEWSTGKVSGRPLTRSLPSRVAGTTVSWLSRLASVGSAAQRAAKCGLLRRAGGAMSTRSLCADMTSSQLNFDGEQLAVYAWGNPTLEPLVLCCHGWSRTAGEFMPWIAPLRQAGYAIVCFDHLGHGRSSGSQAFLPEFVDALHSVSERYAPAAAVIGHGVGGTAAMVALSEGLKADRAILVAPASDPMGGGTSLARAATPANSLTARPRNDDVRREIGVPAMGARSAAPAIGRPGLIIHDIHDLDIP